ncbi:MAG: glycosyltransferase family 9 protein, partial [Gemmatimonadales bacterium]
REARDRVDAKLIAAGVAPDERVVVLHPGSGGNSIEWPPECFGALGARLGADAGVRIVVTGIERERALCDMVVATAGAAVGAIPLAGQLELSELVALLDRSALVVANSTGVLHVAAALGVPVLGLYPFAPPALSAARWGPYTERAAVLTPPAEAPGEMTRITPDAAEAAARRMLAGRPRD